MECVLPAVAGLLCGVLGGAPYVAAFAVMKRRREATVVPGMVAVCVSIVVVALSVLAGWALMRETMLVFAIALVVSFLAVVALSVMVYGRKPRS